MSLKGRAVTAWNTAILAAIMIGSLRSALYIHNRGDEMFGAVARCEECTIGELCPSHEQLIENAPKPRGLWLARYLRLD